MENFQEANSSTAASNIANETTEGYNTLVPEYARVTFAVVTIVVFVLGTIGNGSVIVVMMSVPKLKSPTDVFIVNLSVADFLFSGGLIFWAVEQINRMQWIFGLFMCRLTSVLTIINLNASVLFLAAMAVNRCKTVRRRRPSTSTGDVLAAKWACVIIWVISLIISSLSWFRRTVTKQMMNENVTMCVWRFPVTKDFWWERVFYGSRVLLGFLIPLFVIIVSYVLVILRLRHTRNQVSVTSPMQMTVTITVFAVITAFVICWFPNHVISVIHAFTLGNDAMRKNLHTYEVNLISICLATFNSCINPILYAWLNTRFREQLHMVKCCKFRSITADKGNRIILNQRSKSDKARDNRDEGLADQTRSPVNVRTNITLLPDLHHENHSPELLEMRPLRNQDTFDTTISKTDV